MKNMYLSSLIQPHSIETLTPENTIEDASIRMNQNNISSVVIIDNNQPVGIFTEYDILKCIGSSLPKSTHLSDVITENLFILKGSVHCHDGYNMMQSKGYRHVIVIDDNDAFCGVVTEGDFIRQTGFIDTSVIRRAEEIMNEAPLMIEKHTLIVDAAKMMSDRHGDYAIVMNGLQAHGLVRERDITHYFTQEDFSADSTVEKLTCSDLHLVQRSIPIQQAAALMEEHGIHQLIVADSQEKIVGILNRHDVLKTLHGAYFKTLLTTIQQKNDNIDELKIREWELQKKDIALNEAQSIAHIGSWYLDLKNNTFEWSNECYNIFGLQVGTSITHGPFFDKVYEDDRANVKKAWDTALKSSSYDIEYRIVVDNTIKWVREKAKLNISKENELLSGIGTIQDISERKIYEEKLEALANYDILTGLANRAFLFAYLQKVAYRIKRENGIAAVVLIGLDHFKDINDSYGHTIGDELLKLVANRLLMRLRKGDFIARLGGDEFAIILDNINSANEAAIVIEEIIAEITQPYTLSNKVEIHIGASAGIVIAPENAEKAEDLIQFGDTALYRAKNEKRGSICYYTEELTEAAKKRILCESRMRRAIENQEFELYYQPQVHISSGRIIGAEALIRWNDPENGLISPNIFIPLAEETGLIKSIGEWVITEACHQGKIWIDKGYNLSLSVNVSAHQLRYQDLPKIVNHALKESGFTPDKLVLELTESAIMHHETEAVAMLHSLRSKGIRLAIDDFGTGYSSYSYLKRFPIDILKIDKSFIDDIPFNNNDMAIVKAIIAMGNTLGYKVLAEGTEHSVQIEFLDKNGCEFYQGYFKSKPVPAGDFEKLL